MIRGAGAKGAMGRSLAPRPRDAFPRILKSLTLMRRIMGKMPTKISARQADHWVKPGGVRVSAPFSAVQASGDPHPRPPHQRPRNTECRLGDRPDSQRDWTPIHAAPAGSALPSVGGAGGRGKNRAAAPRGRKLALEPATAHFWPSGHGVVFAID